MPSTWKKVNDNRWERLDGAVVKYDVSSPNPNPAKETARMWTAWAPDPSQASLSMSRCSSLLRWPRRWKSAEKAMQAVDKAYPEEKPCRG
jgi:hypothetical protein